jgi:hypothetical protein
VEWDEFEVADELRSSKFTRDRSMWRSGGVDQPPLDLRELLSNLGTYAIHETKGKRRVDGKDTLVLPLRQMGLRSAHCSIPALQRTQTEQHRAQQVFDPRGRGLFA